ncbi:hypothetical protein GCM10007391_13070 [Alteromonas halophila]|uniref:Uncharacterized protein n=1 Tax=Alteromonas halophila TaxID=516698 RepID=A0A918JHL6_9ALTE|nr:hypothetical protein GCM10007391_13070 [Alteromonas halophila]
MNCRESLGTCHKNETFVSNTSKLYKRPSNLTFFANETLLLAARLRYHSRQPNPDLFEKYSMCVMCNVETSHPTLYLSQRTGVKNVGAGSDCG